MSKVFDDLFSALLLVKQFVDGLLERNGDFDLVDLEEVMQALDVVKAATQEKITEAPIPLESDVRSLRVQRAVNYNLQGGAGGSSNRRRRIPGGSLFVSNGDSNSEDEPMPSWHENPLFNDMMPASPIDNAQQHETPNDGAPNAHVDTPSNSQSSSEHNFAGPSEFAVQHFSGNGDALMRIQSPLRNDPGPSFSNAQEHEHPNDGAPRTHADTPLHSQNFSEGSRALLADLSMQGSPPVFDELNHFLNHDGLEDLLFGNGNGNMQRGSLAQEVDQYMQDVDAAPNNTHEERVLDGGQEDLWSVVGGSAFYTNDIVGDYNQDVHPITENDPASRFFDDAFLDDRGQPLVDQVPPRDFSEDPEFKYYVDLARRTSFRLPQTDGGDGTQDVGDVETLLSPLLREGISLTPDLFHGLLYTLIPGPLHIQELPLDSGDADWDLPIDETFSAILKEDSKTVSMLIIGNPSTKTVHLIRSERHGISLDELGEKLPILHDWSKTVEDIDASVEPNETALIMVYLAELSFIRTHYETTSPSTTHPRDLRLHFLSELLSSSEQECVLTQCGIPEELPKGRRIDTRRQWPNYVPEADRDSVLIPELDHFNMLALREVVAERPAGIKTKRWLRILQCVNEIGSTQILSSVKLSLQKFPTANFTGKGDQPFVEKLLYIHMFLNSQETLNHISVAKSRYIKYGYYEAYHDAVTALSEAKQCSLVEQKKLASIRESASFKNGLFEELPPTPHSDQIREVYSQLTEDERKKRAPDMVKYAIIKRILAEYRGYSWDETKIRDDINRYIKEGRALHHMLQDSVCLSPTLLILFPSCEAQPPLLNIDTFLYELDLKEAKALNKPIKVQDIDDLTQDEAIWFGRVLQTRPGLLDRVPKNALGFLQDDLACFTMLSDRDPRGYGDKPLSFFADGE